MKMEIKKLSGDVIYSAEANTVAALLALAIKDGISLYGANLRGAKLEDANLEDANLRDANLEGANKIETGESWETYLAETVPALLVAGGKHLSDILTAKVWDCHSWENCPMATAFDVHSVADIPVLLRPRAEQFIRYFDAKLIPMEMVGKQEVKA
jgi:hypothetical protein